MHKYKLLFLEMITNISRTHPSIKSAM